MRFWRESMEAFEEPQPPIDDVPKESERGQSLVEYAVLTAWMTLASIAIIHGIGDTTKKVWTTANNDLTQANVVIH
jgi:Flp pilus assembly pilin Flp